MPRVRLTATNVRTLAPLQGRQTDYTDALLPGLVLRVGGAGARTYAVAAWVRGAKRRVTIGKASQMTLAAARERARDVREQLARGEEPRPPGAADLTVGTLVADCLKALTLRPSTRREWDRILKVEILPAIGDRPAAHLRRADVRAWMRGITPRSGWVANHAFAVLRRAYSWGLREDLVETNPCAGLALPHEPRSNDRILSTAELRALLRAIERGARRYPLYADATLLLLLTGVRRDAALGARRAEFEDLDGQEPRWVVPATRSKSGRAHVVPLSAAAVAIVRRRLEATTGACLFPAGHGSVRSDRPASWAGRWRTWLRARVERAAQAAQRASGQPRAAVARWTIHGLRHTVATHLIEDLGVARHVVSLLLGHTMPGPSATKIYDRAELLPERRAALVAWAAWLERLRTREGGTARVLPMVRGGA